MRVYERISFNLNQIKFKDNKDFLDTLLKKYGYKYVHVAFDFAMGSDTCYQRINKNFPTLEKYKTTLPATKETYFSSIRDLENGEDIFVDSEDILKFSALLKKIPNPINFGSMEIVLDGIDWYGDGSGQKVGKSNHSFGAFGLYYNNGIRFIKHWDFGNKSNIIQFSIDRTLSEDEIRPYPEAFEKMIAELGKPYHRELQCVFGEKEKKSWEEAKKPLQTKILTENFSELFAEYIASEKERNFQPILLRIDEELTPISGFSPKKGFSKAAKKYGFKYKTFGGQCYVYQKINKNNHLFKVEITNKSFSSVIGGGITIHGYNFNHYYNKNIPQTLIHSEEDAEKYAEKLFNAASLVEEKYAEELLSTYGKTPVWYKY